MKRRISTYFPLLNMFLGPIKRNHVYVRNKLENVIYLLSARLGEDTLKQQSETSNLVLSSMNIEDT